MTVTFKGAAKRLDDLDLPRLGATIGVGEDEIHAFLDVEAGGSGFDGKGRPKMLFEPHVFFRNTSGADRDKAVAMGLAYPRWRRNNYPGDSYPRLLAAMKINETAALKASSWGAFQILGENHMLAGYATPQAMVEAFAADEEHHLQAMINFLKAKRIDDALRAHNWREIEKIYNGGGYGGAYARKMEAAYDKWRNIRDTPWPPAAGTGPAGTVPDVPPPRPRGLLAALIELIMMIFKRR